MRKNPLQDTARGKEQEKNVSVAVVSPYLARRQHIRFQRGVVQQPPSSRHSKPFHAAAQTEAGSIRRERPADDLVILVAVLDAEFTAAPVHALVVRKHQEVGIPSS